jgi:activator of HSP90 ATPase
MNTKTVDQKVRFKATPHEVYEALMDSAKHSEFTHSEAKISGKVGGKFSAYDGWIEGINVELKPDKRIVQKWRGADWPKGHFSLATFELKEVEGGTELSFSQEGVPEDFYEDIDRGWVEHYWTPMKLLLDG